jgi:hypothetical protein
MQQTSPEVIKKLFSNHSKIVKKYEDADIIVQLITQGISYHDLCVKTEKVLESLLNKNPEEIQWIKNPTPRMQKIAVSRNANCIRFTKQSKKLCKIALNQDASTIRWIKNPSIEQKQFAIQQDPKCIRFINNPNIDLIMKAIAANKEIVELIDLTQLNIGQLRQIKLAIM